ncbi:hypothetical protein [Nitrobacter sp.]|uniref:hypothetical protein n=1 Tax=Nitrobacter sp. TaxID=29420 RepID=UPI0029CAC123|nr:hypothetical protein [Nitrobacter sp.]
MNSLVREVTDAHRVYIDAFIAWERTLHLASCPACRSERVSKAEQRSECAEAEAEKERCRRVFQTLLDELGYVPEDRERVELPDVDAASCRPN